MLYSNMAMVWAEIVLQKNIDQSTVAGLHVSELDRSKQFIPTTWMGPSDCWPLYSNRTKDMDAQFQHDTTPRGYGGHTQNSYNDSGPTPLSFGIGSEGYYHGNNQFGTRTTTRESSMATHQRDTYDV